MCQAYKVSFADPEFRDDCNFVLFTESELEEITATNLKARRHYSPPAPVSPTLEELCDQLLGVAVAVLPTLIEPAPTEAPEVEENTPTAEPILIEGSPGQ